MFIITAAAADITRAVQKAIQIAHHVFVEVYQLPLNFGLGKIEVSSVFLGPGPKAAKNQLFVEQQGRLYVMLGDTSAEVIVTDIYKHLGTTVTAGGTMAPEISLIIAATWSAIAQHSKTFFRSANIKPDVKRLTLQPLLLSRLSYSVGVWPLLRDAQLRRMKGAYLKILHLIHGAPKEKLAEPHSHVHMQIATEAPHLSDVFRLLGLRALPRTLKTAPQFLLQVLDCEKAYREALSEDFIWLDNRVPKLEELGEPALALASWAVFCKQYPGAWKGTFRPPADVVYRICLGPWKLLPLRCCPLPGSLGVFAILRAALHLRSSPYHARQDHAPGTIPVLRRCARHSLCLLHAPVSLA